MDCGSSFLLCKKAPKEGIQCPESGLPFAGHQYLCTESGEKVAPEGWLHGRRGRLPERFSRGDLEKNRQGFCHGGADCSGDLHAASWRSEGISPEIYILCGNMLSRYRNFRYRLMEPGDCVCAQPENTAWKCPRVSAALSLCGGNMAWIEIGLMVNLCDTKWNRLLEVLDTETYPSFVCENLCRRPYTAADISGVLANYKALTGKDLTEGFWHGGRYAKELLEKLVSVKLFDLDWHDAKVFRGL